MSAKNDFVKHLQRRMTVLAQEAEVAGPLSKFYSDNGYNSGGSDPIVDADISSTTLTAVEVASIITLLDQFDNFQGNVAVTTGDYKSTMNKARIDITE